MQSVVIYVYSRLVLNTAIETFTDVEKSYEVSSLAIAEVVEMPFKTGYKQLKQMLAVSLYFVRQLNFPYNPIIKC